MTLTINDKKIVAQVMIVLQKNCKYHQSHSVLASLFNITEQKLRKIFKEASGKTINQFQTEIRIEKAKELLFDSDDPVKAIAKKIGYDKRNFERQFKNSTGITPLQWRLMNRQTVISPEIKRSSDLPLN